MKHAVIVMLVCLLLLVCHDAFTDMLYLTNGTRREGTVMHEDEKKVVLRIGDEKDGVDVAFSRNEVLRIDKVGTTPVIEVPLTQGSLVKIPPPRINEEPLFVNQTEPIAADEEGMSEEGASSETVEQPLEAPPESVGDAHSLQDAESALFENKEAHMQETLEKYLEQTNNTHASQHH